MQTWILPPHAPAVALSPAIAGDAMSYAVEPAKFFDVDVDELARMFTLVTAHRLGGLQRCQSVEPQAPQNAADGRWRDAQLGCDLLAGVALAAETLDLGDDRLRRRPMQPMGPRTAIAQSSQALAAISGNPFANGPRADACGFADGFRRLPARNLPYNSLSTVRGQTGILVHVHPVLPWNLKSQQPQLPRSEPDGQPAESSHLE